MDELVFNGWLSREELILHRMRSFHRKRIEDLRIGQPRDKQEKDGKLLIHCIPEQAIMSRKRFTVSELRKHGEALRAPDSPYGNIRLNADGFACSEGPNGFGGYSQLFRDGRLEAVLSRASYHSENAHYIVDTACERAILQATRQYLAFSKAIGIAPPIWMFCTLVNVEGAAFRPHWGQEGHTIDRPVVELPETEIACLEIKVDTHLRPLLDCIWNAMGFEASPNYDDEGNYRERR
jgi:hypothetical protein